MFKKRKFTITFKKSYHSLDFGRWEEVTDGYLMSVLLKLQEKYDFEVVSTSFKDCFSNSRITIKCDKRDKQKIFMEYTTILGDNITKVSF